MLGVKKDKFQIVALYDKRNRGKVGESIKRAGRRLQILRF